MKIFQAINFSPFAHNMLDYIGRADLVTAKGIPVNLRRSGNKFACNIGAEHVETDDNVAMSYFLNIHEVGTIIGEI